MAVANADSSTVLYCYYNNATLQFKDKSNYSSAVLSRLFLPHQLTINLTYLILDRNHKQRTRPISALQMSKSKAGKAQLPTMMNPSARKRSVEFDMSQLKEYWVSNSKANEPDGAHKLLLLHCEDLIQESRGTQAKQ